MKYIKRYGREVFYNYKVLLLNLKDSKMELLFYVYL